MSEKSWLTNRISHWASLGYQAGTHIHRWMYQKGVFHRQRLPRPTISIGNITAGGTGKTPLVIRLATDLVSLGLKPAILLRGYKRPISSRKPIIVRDYEKINVSYHQAGDEAFEIASRLQKTYVGVGSNRFEVGQMLLRQNPTIDCFILDDGFQHHNLERDLNLVIIDATNPWGHGRLLPAGELREFPSALQRAQAVIISRARFIAPDRLSVLKEEVASYLKPSLPILFSHHQSVSLLDLKRQDRKSLDLIRGRELLVVSGIGNPQAFELELSSLGGIIKQSLRCSDHGGKPSVVWKWIKRHQKQGVWVVMTEKDAIRWTLGGTRIPALSHVYMMQMVLDIFPTLQPWESLLQSIKGLCDAH